MKRIIVSFTLVLISAFALAQNVNLSGTIKNSEDKAPIQYAVLSLVRQSDSILYKFTRTDAEGHFNLKSVQPGNYIMIASHPRYADMIDELQIAGDVELTSIELTPKSKVLQEIIINTGTPIRVKGDTTIYTADSFVVSANANVEELLKKLPGIQVDKDGTIKAMGQTVEKVLVDGEIFFGNDPGMAVKNIRADAVKEVQVFDKKSEQAEFTGIDDGQTQKTINLKLKDGSKRGYFGKIDLAGGLQQNIEDRYLGNLLFGSFKGKRKFSAFLLSGNTGQDGLSWQDEVKYGMSNIEVNTDNGISMMIGGSRDDEVYLDPNSGFLSATNAGLHYSNKWNDKQELSFSPKFNQQSYENRTTTFSRTQVGDSTLISNTDETGFLNRHNFKNNAVMEFTIDSMNSVKITANANLYHTESSKFYNAVSTGENGNLKNKSERASNSINDKSAISGKILFKHKFHKPRRTLSIAGDWNVMDSKGTQFLNSFNQSYFDGAPAGSRDIDQMMDKNATSTDLSGNITYTEPLGKKISLLLDYKLALNNGKNDLITYEHTPGGKDYNMVIDSLSNQFRQHIIQQIPGITLNFDNKKWKINVGTSVGFISYQLKDISFDKHYDRNYTNFYPSVNMSYKIKSNNSIRFYYSGRTEQPSINQLQPLRNNNDYFNQYIGNPHLKPSFQHTFRLGHNSYNFLKNLWTYQSLRFSLENNSITNSRIIDLDSGKTITKPINTDGSISAGFWTGFGFKIKKIDLNIQIGPSFYYNRYVEMINNKKSFSEVFSPEIGISLRKSKEKKYEFSIHNSLGYHRNKTAQSDKTIDYFSNTLQANAKVYYKKVWSVGFDYEFYAEQASTYNPQDLNRHILNGQLQRTFKDDEFTMYFKVRDILNQNIGLRRNFYGSTYSEVTSDRLRRYIMLGFSWNFKNKGSQPQK